MKQLFILGAIILMTVPNVDAQDFSKLDKSPMDVAFIRTENNMPMIRVIYSRPQKDNRKVFGGLVPFGEVWRTGANEATEITLYSDMMVNAQKLIPAGTYTLYTIPEKHEWTIIFNKEVNVWGAFSYDETKDVLRVKVPVEQTSAPVQAFSMTFQPIENGANLFMGWDDTYVEVPFVKSEK